MEKEFRYTEEQFRVFEFIKHSYGSAVVNAFAGSGKTKTIVTGLECIIDKNALFLAHNKSIQLNLENKIEPILLRKVKEEHPRFSDEQAKQYLSTHKNIKIYTYHSLGLHLLIDYLESSKSFPLEVQNEYQKYKERRDGYADNEIESKYTSAFAKFADFMFDNSKYKKYIYNNIEMLGEGVYETLSYNMQTRYKKNLISLTDLSRHNKCQCEREVLKVAKKYGVPIIKNECHIVPNILNWGKKNLRTVDYQDLLWLPYELKYGASKKYLVDFIMIDEAQDSSPLQQELLKKCLARGGRFIAVGDKNQAINSFCGSDEQSFNSLMKLQPGMTEFTLSTCFRCDKKIIDHAIAEVKKLEEKYNIKTSIDGIKARDDADDGTILYNVKINNIEDGSLVICRNTSPLIKLYRMLVKMGKNVAMIGETAKSPWIEFIVNSEHTLAKDIVTSAKRYLIETWLEYSKCVGSTLEDSVCSTEISALYDYVKSIEYVCKDFETKEQVLYFIAQSIKKQEGNQILLSTIHKAKGLEADSVYMLSPSLIPSKLVREDQEWEKISETNLLYVAITRAKHKFGYIDENEVDHGSGFSSKNERYNEMKKIKETTFDFDLF